jgi:phospho-N-acetylmuramoyl-pentapeptide-transferase
MLYHLAAFADSFGPLRLFQYITVRTALATMTALFLSILLGPWFIRTLQRLRVAHLAEREELGFHEHKLGTPSMGGLLIVGVLCFSMILFGNFTNRYVSLLLLVTIGLASVGFIDDYLKLTKRNPKGLSGRYKILGQTLLALTVGVSLYILPVEAGNLWMGESVGTEYGTILAVPFLKKILIPLGILYIPFVVIVIVGASNAVNLTDGLDGLAAGSTIACAFALAGLTYLIGHTEFSSYLNVMYIRNVGEMTVFLGALIGALLGFLWFNAYPAQVFMGDTGSLALGGALGTVAVIIKQELLLVIIGGIFVAEALSVIIQVLSFQLTGRRVFRMAPLHHHFELAGWPEPKVIIRFWIIAFVLTLFALATLKLR